MFKLTDAQVLAAAAQERLVNIVSSPGSGKTTIAAERYGYLRYSCSDLRGVLGLTFNRAAAIELRNRINARWGEVCIASPHRVITFDQLHVELLHHLLEEGRIFWPGRLTKLDVRDDYCGIKGVRSLKADSYIRYASLDDANVVVSKGRKTAKGDYGIGTVDDHRATLSNGIVSHGDVRTILESAMRLDEMRKFASDWLCENHRSLIIDEVYDANALDLYMVYLAAESGLSVTLIGDPWQALYKWRGAQPEVVKELFEMTTEEFIDYAQPESFRFSGDQMPKLAAKLRAGQGVVLPEISTEEVDVVLARNWMQLWTAGNNVLPLAFQTVHNSTDAAMNLLLDVATRARFGVPSFGRENAIAKLKIDRNILQARQVEVLGSVLMKLQGGCSAKDVLKELRDSVKVFGTRQPSRLKEENEIQVETQLDRLRLRLTSAPVVPGLTVFQAKGREWDRVGVVLSREQLDSLASGLRELDEEHCIIYVALTRARRACGCLVDRTGGLGSDELLLGI